MKFSASFILFLFSGFLSFSQKHNISLTVSYIQPYCGGARPSREMLEMAHTPKPFVEKTVVVVNEKGKALKLKTDTAGKINTKLKAGNYKLYEVWRFKKNTPDGQSLNNYDSNCLKIEWKKEFAVLSVDSKKIDYKETNGIIINCNWLIPCMIDSLKPQIPE